MTFLQANHRRALLSTMTLLIAVGLWWALGTRSQKPAGPAAPPPLTVPEGQAGKAGEVVVTEQALKLAEIDLISAEVRQVQERLQVTGQIETGGNQIAKVTPKAAGKVVRLLVGLGDDVREGQVLAILESAELAAAQADYRQASARVRALRSNLQRQRDMASLGEFGSDELETSRLKTIAAEQAVQASSRSLAQHESALVEAKSQLSILKGEVSQSRSELEVKKAHLARAEALPEVVSLQQMERLRADAEQASVALAMAQSRVEQGEAAVKAAGQSLRLAKQETPLVRRGLQVTQGAQQREERIYASGYSRSRELLQAESELEMAQVELQGAEDNVGLLGGSPGAGNEISLVSPIAGRVQDTSLTLGESVGVEHLAFTVINLDHVWARLAVSPADLAKVKIGNLVELETDSAPGKVLKARITSIGAAADEATRTVPVRAELESKDESLRAGAFAKASIITEVRHERLTVPQTALQDHTGRATLYVAKGGQKGVFEVRHITLGEQGPDWREVKEGLKPGESLAAHGTFYLKSEALKNSLSDGCCAVEN